MTATIAARVASRKHQMKAPLRSKAKTLVTKARRFIVSNELESAESTVEEAIVALDKAASKGAIHPKNAARRKSRLVSQLNRASQS